MRLKVALVLAAGIAVVGGAGIAIAAHAPQLDPATVPTGLFVTHNRVAEVPISPFARAAAAKGADVQMAHLRFGPNQAFAWHTHPGPIFVNVRSGSLTYQDTAANACRNRTYVAGEGFVDPGFGHVHRVIAGPAGADIYSTGIYPPGYEIDPILVSAPEDCS
jgi:quercetin dioxygenase-like cupin family protein